MSDNNPTGRRVWNLPDPTSATPLPPKQASHFPPQASKPTSAVPPVGSIQPAIVPPSPATAAPAPTAVTLPMPTGAPVAYDPPPATLPQPGAAAQTVHGGSRHAAPPAPTFTAMPASAARVDGHSAGLVDDPTYALPVVGPSTASVGSVYDAPPAPGAGQYGTDPDLVACLNAVVLAGASDLHVSAKAPPMMRVDGSLQPIPGFPVWTPEKVSQALESVLTATSKKRFEDDLELDFAYTLSETARFRVNLYRQRDSLGAAFRLIPTQIKKLDALGIPEKVGYFSTLARGLVLVTGPTGSGKSTTLAALIDLVNSTRRDHIVTVEDPIEFMHRNKKSLVNQREVGHDTHSFASALKHVLRQDPDVILIGELRDLETISVALTAAETGHLVFATLHTQDAGQTIDRVIDVFPPHQQGQVRTQLAATLQGVVCQTLVKRAGGAGRAVATEILVTTPAIANLIREGKTYQIRSALQAGREQGMHTMDQHLAELVHAGVITAEVGRERAQNAEDFKQLLNRYDGSSIESGSMR